MIMAAADFDRSVFINCPFDRDYEPLLQAILFALVYLGLAPRIASERLDGGETRIDKIKALIEASRHSIHDLSRCQARDAGEFYRLNMPFELGLDYGCRHYGGRPLSSKRLLVLEEHPYRYQAALSDLAGCDIVHHDAKAQVAIRRVRNWFSGELDPPVPAASRIHGAFMNFLEWNYRRLLGEGFSEADIQDYPTAELLGAMRAWMARPAAGG
jgi:hypothetical protein